MFTDQSHSPDHPNRTNCESHTPRSQCHGIWPFLFFLLCVFGIFAVLCLQPLHGVSSVFLNNYSTRLKGTLQWQTRRPKKYRNWGNMKQAHSGSQRNESPGAFHPHEGNVLKRRGMISIRTNYVKKMKKCMPLIGSSRHKAFFRLVLYCFQDTSPGPTIHIQPP